MTAREAYLEARVGELHNEIGQLRQALDSLRSAHHTPYVDEDHQGSNCVDLILSLLSEKVRVERERDQARLDMAGVEGERDAADDACMAVCQLLGVDYYTDGWYLRVSKEISRLQAVEGGGTP
jgi:hypothetical protein